MTKYVIFPSDKFVQIDNSSKHFEEASLNWPLNIHCWRFDTETNTGEIEYVDNTIPNENINSISSDIQTIVNHAEEDKAENERIEALPYYEKPGYNSWDRVREERNRFLQYLDKFLTAKDWPMNNKSDLLTFRQALRDVPETYASSQPENVRFTPELNIEVDGTVVNTLPENFK